MRISLLKFNNLKKKKKKICKDLYITFKSGKITQNLNKKGENIKFLNNLNKQLLKKQKQKTI